MFHSQRKPPELFLPPTIRQKKRRWNHGRLVSDTWATGLRLRDSAQSFDQSKSLHELVIKRQEGREAILAMKLLPQDSLLVGQKLSNCQAYSCRVGKGEELRGWGPGGALALCESQHTLMGKMQKWNPAALGISGSSLERSYLRGQQAYKIWGVKGPLQEAEEESKGSLKRIWRPEQKVLKLPPVGLKEHFYWPGNRAWPGEAANYLKGLKDYIQSTKAAKSGQYTHAALVKLTLISLFLVPFCFKASPSPAKIHLLQIQPIKNMDGSSMSHQLQCPNYSWDLRGIQNM